MRGVCMTCTGTCGSGAGTGMTPTDWERGLIHRSNFGRVLEVVRGGDWGSDGGDCRSARRGYVTSGRFSNNGFRVFLAPGQHKQSSEAARSHVPQRMHSGLTSE